MKSKIKDTSSIIIKGFMVEKLNLKGNELLIYGIIHGFSQDGESKFTGSLQYLSDWTNSTKQGVMKCLKSLESKGFIVKFEMFKNGIKFCEYHATEFNTPCNKVSYPMKQSLMGGMQQSLPNNITLDNLEENKDYNIDNINDENLTNPIEEKSVINFTGGGGKKDNPKSEKFNFKNRLLSLNAKEKLIDDWLLVRKNKKATNTETSLIQFINEVEKSGLGINKVLEICISRDWRGFDCSWLDNNKSNNQTNQKQTYIPPKIQNEIDFDNAFITAANKIMNE